MIKQDILRCQSRRRVRAVFRKIWPMELRERWPQWMREAIDQAERLAAQSYEEGVRDAVEELKDVLTKFGRR